MSEEEAYVDRGHMLSRMIRSNLVWIDEDEEGERIFFAVNCNDLWSWASADYEEIPYSEIENCYKLGPITWACVRRGVRPFDACEEQMKEAGEWNSLLDALPVRNQRG